MGTKNFLVVLLMVSFLTLYFVRYDKGDPFNLSRLWLLSNCEKPVHFRLGEVDKRFNLGEKEVLNDINKASSIWNDAYPKKLLVYDPDASLSINFVFDQRQALNDQIKTLQNQLNEKKSGLSPEIADYEKRSAEFKNKVSDLNQRISYWNELGGAPEDEYKKLIVEQENLKKEADDLNKLAAKLNLSAQNYNAQVGKLNQTVDIFKEALTERPEEGLFNPQEDRIDIYFVIDKDELIHTISHELGHSIGLNHVESPKSIMYGFTNKLTGLSPADKKALQDYCQDRTVPEVIYSRINYLAKLAGYL